MKIEKFGKIKIEFRFYIKNSFYSLKKIYKNNNKLVCVGFDDLFIRNFFNQLNNKDQNKIFFIRKTNSLIKDCKRAMILDIDNIVINVDNSNREEEDLFNNMIKSGHKLFCNLPP